MNTTTETVSLQQLHKLAAFARYLLTQRLEEFIRKQLSYTFELDIPLLRFFLTMTEEQRYELSKKTITEFLNYLSKNKAAAQIEASMQLWKANQLPVVDRDAIVAEDITLINYLRKKSMLHFVPDYTKEANEIIELVKEIDFFIIQSITTATNLYIDLFRKRVEEHSHFVQKVADTVPGAVYVFDVLEYKGLYANNKLPEVIGYSQTDLNTLGENTISSLVHPADQRLLLQQQAGMKAAKDNEVLVVKYRIKTKDGSYKWLANYEAVFKRKEDAIISQIIGITLDVNKEEKAVEELHNREQQLLEAQNIAQLGNYYWDFENKRSSGSAKTRELLGIVHADFENFLQNVHPDDREKVKQETENALKTGIYTCEFRVPGNKSTKNILARGVVEYCDGKAVGMSGTVLDVTQQTTLINGLAEADKQHKQAEALAHIGTYAWSLTSGEIDWSDEMYRIYETDKSARLDYSFVYNSMHPDDRETVSAIIQNSIQTATSFDFYYRIITKKGTEKILHSRGQVQSGSNGQFERLVGTDQDVTEKQKLLQRLQKSESLYKKAEEIAGMGNWRRDAYTGKIEWTDQLYKIYGLVPQSEEITEERFLSFIHPADREIVKEGIALLGHEVLQDYTFRIITRDGVEKWLRSIAEIVYAADGKMAYIIGIEQDVTEKQNLIERLQESEKLYKQAQSLTRMGNWTWDLITKIFTWSDELYTLYQLPKGQPLTEEQWNNYVDPSEKEYLYAALQESIATAKPMDVTHKLLLPDGKIKIVHRKGEMIYDEAGRAVKMIGTTQDITEQFKTAEQLKESKTFIQKITDATPSIIASYNVSTGAYTFISEGMQKLLGYNREEVMRRGIAFLLEIIHPDDLKIIEEENSKAIEEASASPDKNDTVMEFTYRMKHADGSYRWFHTYGTIFDRNAAGKVEHILNISLDVTEQHQAIETIKEQEHFIQQIADASPTILYLFDVPTQSMVYINREAFFVLGYLPDELMEEGAAITALLYHPEDRHLLPGRKESKLSFQQVDNMIQYECRMKHKDGGYRWILVREIVFKTSADESVKQIIGAALDINRRKEMEKTILQNTVQLQQSNASLEEFAYVASHDLKEPLRKISTFGDRLMASQTDNLTEEGNMYLRKIVDASQRMQAMISDLLAISMISGNKLFEAYSLQKILEETLQTLEHKIELQAAVIRYDNLPEASIVPSQMRQLFQNLIANSLKFVREGVQPLITISCKWIDAEEAGAFQLTKAEKYLRLRFTDNGIGFENEYAQKIFSIFQRLHGRSEYEGSGIGLAICKKIAEHHGGVIYATGQPDAGATFTIILPA